MLTLTYDGREYRLPMDVRSIPLYVNRELELQTRSGGACLSLEDNISALAEGRARPHHVCAHMFASLRYAGEPANYLLIEQSYDRDKLEQGFAVEGVEAPEVQGAD